MTDARTLERALNGYNAGIGDDRLRLDMCAEALGRAEHVHICRARSGNLTLRVRGDARQWVTLHSMVNPEQDCMAGAADPAADGELLVVCGAGMGYHIAACLQAAKGAPVVVVERDPAVLALLLAYQPPAAVHAGGPYVIAGPDIDEVMGKLALIKHKTQSTGVRILEHKPSVRAFPGFYAELKRRVAPASSGRLEQALKYGKFSSAHMKILILHSKYYLLAEIIQALRRLGHEARTIMLPESADNLGTRAVITHIIQEIVEHRPDFVLTVNHIGFDREGILTRFFNDIHMPYASWFVDSPLFILEDFSRQHSEYLVLFLWDNDYVADLKDMGFARSFFLPLATDPLIFTPVRTADNPLAHLACRVGFVGSTWTNSLSKCLAGLPFPERARELLHKMSGRFMQSPERRIGRIAFALHGEDERLFDTYMNRHRRVFEPAVTWAATHRYRLSCIKALQPFGPTICGDPAWAGLVNGSARICRELNYYDDLPFFYNVCEINFNTTSLQMKTGFNQRIFDVPASGGFLLTDYREQLHGAFDVGEEIVCYREIDEIPELVSFYARHPALRQAVTEKARRRILHEHTYVHRLDSLTRTMRRLYG